MSNASKAAPAATGGAYFLGMVGIAVYYLQHAATFWDGVWGLLKALVWPAFLVYQLASFLRM
jgi:hypothetical protein